MSKSSKYYPIIIVLLLITIGLLIRNSYVHTGWWMSDMKKLSEENLKKEEEIQSILNGFPRGLSEFHKKKYSFQEFGVFSPMFEGKEINVADFNFRRRPIKEMIIRLENPFGNNITYEIKEWEYGKTVFNDNLYTISNFDGAYAQLLDVSKIQSLLKIPTHSSSVAYLDTNPYSVSLSYFPPASPNNKPKYMLIKPVYTGGGEGYSYPPSMNSAYTNDLRKITKTLDYIPY